MKYVFLIFITLFINLIVVGQKKATAAAPPKVQTKRQLELEEKNHECIRKQATSFSVRLKNYPFNTTSQVKLVSFLQKLDNDNADDENKYTELPKLNDTICYSKLHEIKNLSITEIDTLTDILYNTGFRGPTIRESEIGCYEPRNAILFIDKNGQTFEYIEICFQCEKVTVSSDRITIGEICNQKFSLIKRFFKSKGIKYGTKE
jgi:hypothetical protein